MKQEEMVLEVQEYLRKKGNTLESLCFKYKLKKPKFHDSHPNLVSLRYNQQSSDFNQKISK